MTRPTLGCSVDKLADLSRTLAGDPAARRSYASNPQGYLEEQGVGVSTASLSRTTSLTTSEVCTLVFNCIMAVNAGDTINAVQKVNAIQLANAVEAFDLAVVVKLYVPGDDYEAAAFMVSQPCAIL
jgi:hypothetical protein